MKFKLKFLIFLIVSCLFFNPVSAEEITRLEYKIIAIYPHDVNAFTQGLEINNNILYEGTGLYGKSSLKKIDLKTFKLIKEIKLEQNFFGEGITILNNKIYQLSWKENTAFVYDLNLNLINSFSYQGEGWGLTNNNKELIMSNGSEYIYFRNPENFKITRKIKVKKADQKITNLNELEYLNGYLYANIWQEDYILKIDSKTGAVRAYLDLTKLLKTNYQGEINVLNGIAYDKKTDSFLVTGKLWPKIYRIKITN